jgi:hypothetical protein
MSDAGAASKGVAAATPIIWPACRRVIDLSRMPDSSLLAEYTATTVAQEGSYFPAWATTKIMNVPGFAARFPFAVVSKSAAGR